MQHKRRVVVTGAGIVTALGFEEETLWTNLSGGRGGIRRITQFDIEPYRSRNGSEVDTEQLSLALKQENLRSVDRSVDMGLVASARALRQAGLFEEDARCGTPIGALFGTGVGPAWNLFNAFKAFSNKGLRGVRPSSVPRCMGNAVSSEVSIRFHLTGPNYAVVSACTSSTTAIGIGFRMIRDGYADRVLCGGTDCVFNPFVYAGWNNLGVMSSNPDPETCSRPFDAARDGCVLGEGAGAIILESMESARNRNASARAELIGYGESSDALHITRPNPEGQAAAMRAALDDAGITPNDVGFINAHGTATKANDECEAASIRKVFGPHADQVWVASNKSFFGHLLGASGVVETVVTILGLEHGQVPPSRNLDNPDPQCNLRLVPQTPISLSSPIAMKNSFGFGGNNAVLVLRKAE